MNYTEGSAKWNVLTNLNIFLSISNVFVRYLHVINPGTKWRRTFFSFFCCSNGRGAVPFLLYIRLQRKVYTSAPCGILCHVHDRVSANNMSDCIDCIKCQLLTSPDGNTLQHAAWLRGCRTIRWPELVAPSEGNWRREDRKTRRHRSKGSGCRKDGKERIWRAEWERGSCFRGKVHCRFYISLSQEFIIVERRLLSVVMLFKVLVTKGNKFQVCCIHLHKTHAY